MTTTVKGPDRGRLYLSPPHLTGEELELLEEAVGSGWMAPLGPMVDAFEAECAEVAGSKGGLATTTGTAAIHLALRVLGVAPGDVVLVSTLTFVGSVTPVLQLGATPVFLDSDPGSWTLDPRLLRSTVEELTAKGKRIGALLVVHLYGQCADMNPILATCDEFGIPVVEDAAEALGATYRERPAGGMGVMGTFSFNGNKIITTSGGGMLVSNDPKLLQHARKLATQAREPEAHYEHVEWGYNYRMSNLLAAVGRAQLSALADRVERRRQIFEYYEMSLSDLPGVAFMPEPQWGRSNRWLTCLTIDPDVFGADREQVRLALEEEDIEARPVWKPMHLQPVFQGLPNYGGQVSERLFQTGLCLPSGTAMSESDCDRVINVIRQQRRPTRDYA